MKQKKITAKQSVNTLEEFNTLLIEKNAVMVLMDTDRRTPIAVVKPNVMNGLIPDILKAIEEEKGDASVKIKQAGAFDYGHALIIRVKIEQDGSDYEEDFEAIMNTVYHTI